MKTVLIPLMNDINHHTLGKIIGENKLVKTKSRYTILTKV